MKKNKSESTFQKMVEKYRLLYFLSFSLGFLVLATIVGVVLYFSVTNIYFQSTQSTILSYSMDYVINVPEGNVPGENPPQGEGSGQNPSFSEANLPRLSDPTMAAVIFYKDQNGEIQEDYTIIGASFSEEFYNGIEEDFAIKSSVDEFELTTINSFYYISYLKEITNPSYMKNGLTGYVKIYSNVDGELKLRDKFVSLYSVIAVIAFIISFGFGLIIMKEATKPLEMFVTKQTNFVSDASHELRTPLAVVQSKIETILSHPDKNVCDVSEDLVISLNEISRLTKLTQELLTLARNDKENLSINLSYVEVNSELKQIVEPFEEIALISGKKLTYEGVDCYARLDKDRLKQIMIINIDNALKYTIEGEEIAISLKAVGNEVQIQITDTGIGLSDEDKKKVFDRFYRVDKARSRETGGNGLGLSIAYTLVKLQKGTINVYDNLPKGSRFVITFPKAKDKQISLVEPTE